MRWEQGRATVEQMLADKELQRVPPSRQHADRLLAQATNHIGTARAAAQEDPEGAYALLYDAARKALTAILENQGLRPTARGGHLAVYHSVRAQLDPPMGGTVQPFDRMRRRRKDAEYPSVDARSWARTTSLMTCRRWRPSWVWPAKCWTRCPHFEGRRTNPARRPGRVLR